VCREIFFLSLVCRDAKKFGLHCYRVYRFKFNFNRQSCAIFYPKLFSCA